MNRLSTDAFLEIKKWIHRNARPLELSLWQYLFENGSKEAVVSLLMYYQNDDGGFGHALEADSWNPNSTPYTTSYAINLLKMIDFTDHNHSIMQGIIQYLNSGYHFSDGSWLFTIPSNDKYAHAPWWSYNSELNITESIGVTAELASFVLRYLPIESDLYQRVIPITKKLFMNIEKTQNFGDIGISGYVTLAQTITELDVDWMNLEKIQPILNQLVYNSIERDIAKWSHYGVRPSNYIKSTDSIYYKQNETIVQKELDYLIETRPQDGVWDITWTWFDNNQIYPKEFAISENWWKAYKAIENVVLLESFDRIENKYPFEVKLPKILPNKKTEHFNIYYYTDSLAEKEINCISAQREKAYEDLSNYLNTDPNLTVDLYLFDHAATKEEETNHTGEGWAFDTVMVELYTETSKCHPYHELVHVFADAIYGTTVSFFSEGLAVFLSNHLFNQDLKDDINSQIQEKVKCFYHQKELFTLQEMFALQIGEKISKPKISYPEAGSIIKYLYSYLGVDRFFELYSSLKPDYTDEGIQSNICTFEKYCGASMNHINSEWLDYTIK